MRHVIGSFGVLASVILLVVSAAMNWRFGFNLGKTEFDSFIFGFASAASDALKALLPFLIAAAWKQRNLMQAAGGTALMAICVVYSLSSALGFAALNRADSAGTRALAVERYADMRTELTRLRTERAALPAHRPAPAVEAEMSALQQNVRWTTSVGCTDVTAAASRELCGAYHRLRGELAAAKQDDTLALRETQITDSLQQTTGTSASKQADPQIDLFAALLGIDAGSIQTGLHLLIAALVELGSSLGLFVSFAYWRVLEPRREPTPPRVPSVVMAQPVQPMHQPAPAEFEPIEGEVEAEPLALPRSDIETFFRERVRIEDGSSVTAMLLADEYRRWCDATGRQAMTAPSFNRQVADLGIQKSKIAGKLRYIGIAMADAGVTQGALVPHAKAQAQLAAFH